MTHDHLPCHYCHLRKTPEGHDGCLGKLPGVINACCGHGEQACAYVQFEDGTELREDNAEAYFDIILGRDPIGPIYHDGGLLPWPFITKEE